MREYMKEYIKEIDTKINDNYKFTKEEIDEFLFKMELFQKERIIHLVITLTYVFFTILFLFLTQYIFAMFIIFFILLVALLGIVLLFYVKKHVLPIVKVVTSFGEKKLVKIDESFRSGFYNYHIRHHVPVLVKEVDSDREMELYCPVYFLLSISIEDKELPVYCVDNIAVFLKEDVKMLRGESK